MTKYGTRAAMAALVKRMQRAFIAISAPALLLTACGQMRPAEVCASEEALVTVKSIIFGQLMAMSGGTELDPINLRRAYDETVRLNLVRFEGVDDQTGQIRCTASLQSAEVNAQLDVHYVRHLEAGSEDVVYVVDGIPESRELLQIVDGVVQRYAALKRAQTPQASAPHSSPVASPLQSEAPANGASSPPSSGGYWAYLIEGYERVPLNSFNQWADEKQAAHTYWQVENGLYRLTLGWKYDDGQDVSADFWFRPVGGDQVRLEKGAKDGVPISADQSEELLSGIVLDMYRRGLVDP